MSEFDMILWAMSPLLIFAGICLLAMIIKGEF